MKKKQGTAANTSIQSLCCFIAVYTAFHEITKAAMSTMTNM